MLRKVNTLMWGMLLAGLLCTPVVQAADTDRIFIDFEQDTLGNVPDGFSSVDSPRVRFFDTKGADLEVVDSPLEVNGIGLEVSNNVPSAAWWQKRHAHDDRYASLQTVAPPHFKQ